MSNVEVKQVRANMTINDMEPHWEVVVDYGAFEVSIPLPARYHGARFLQLYFGANSLA